MATASAASAALVLSVWPLVVDFSLAFLILSIFLFDLRRCRVRAQHTAALFMIIVRSCVMPQLKLVTLILLSILTECAYV